MTGASDSWDEMRHDYEPAEPLVAELLGELRSWAQEPAPAPSATLAVLLDGDAEPCVRATPGVSVPLAPHAFRRKRMIAAKLAGLGVAAKVTLGLGVATAAVATAGATGVLPTQTGQVSTDVQVSVPTSVTTPDVSIPGVPGVSIPDVSVPTTTPRVSIPGVTIPGADALDDDADGDSENSGKRADNHGACVSAVARDSSLQGRDHGKAVSAVAQSDCGKPASSASPSPSSSTTTTTTVAGAGQTDDDGGNRGRGGSSSNSGTGSLNSGRGSSNSGGKN